VKITWYSMIWYIIIDIEVIFDVSLLFFYHSICLSGKYDIHSLKTFEGIVIEIHSVFGPIPLMMTDVLFCRVVVVVLLVLMMCCYHYSCCYYREVFIDYLQYNVLMRYSDIFIDDIMSDTVNIIITCYTLMTIVMKMKYSCYNALTVGNYCW